MSEQEQPQNLEDVVTVIDEQKKASKRQRKKEKKEKKKKLKMDLQEMNEQDMDNGLVVANDDVQYDIDKCTQYKESMTAPLDIMDGLLSIDKDGELYFQGQKQDTDASHAVNRHVIKVLMKEFHEDIGTEGEQRMVDIAGRHSFETTPLSDTQNTHKNTYVKKIRDQIKKRKSFSDEQKYLSFDHNGGELYLKHKTRKPIIKKGVHFEEKARMEREMEKNKGLDQRVIELEAENAVLRQKRADVGPHNPTMANRPDIVPEIETLRSQVLNVDAATQLAQPGPYVPDYMPLYRSPDLHFIQKLFYQDKNNYRQEHDNAIFGDLFNPGTNTYSGIFS